MVARRFRVPKDFWDPSDRTFKGPPLSDAMVSRAQKALGYRLPATYLALIRTQNGGTPTRTFLPFGETSEDDIEISGIRGIGGKWGIDAPKLGSAAMIREWGYPHVGVVVCECPSAGHDTIMLDYSEGGSRKAPRVIHVETEGEPEPRVRVIAPSFGDFLSRLRTQEELDELYEDDE